MTITWPGPPPRRRLSWQYGLWVAVVLAIVWFASQSGPPVEDAPSPVVPAHPAAEFEVDRVIDGDTLKLKNHARVRLIGVNAPESVKPDWPVEPFGPEASAFTHRFVDGHVVRLEFDRERTDQYGRWLAHVWVGDKLLNEELVRAGLARWEPHYQYAQAFKTRYRKAEAEARAAKRGIWSLRENEKRSTRNDE
ncbi:MAG: thermonuclease family protein [Planctomycetes bacterium]|nr:thermonuclease family protein [Planctomycetota bacterium]